MKIYLMLSTLLFVLAGCCEFDHPDYLGERDEVTLKKMINDRFLFNTLDGMGNVDVDTEQYDGGLNFSMLLDKKQECVRVSFEYSILGNLTAVFDLSLTPWGNRYENLHEKVGPLGVGELSDNAEFKFFPGVQVEEFRQMLSSTWKASDPFSEEEDVYKWGHFEFDKETLVLKRAVFDDFVWNFLFDKQREGWQGPWKPYKWTFKKGDGEIEFEFDQGLDAEDADFTRVNDPDPMEKEYFEIEIKGKNYLGKASK